MIDPIFIPVSGGSLFSLHYIPADNKDSQKWVVILSPFFEEMNKCRKQISLQARDLVDKGYHVVVPDYAGTGDSHDELEQITWPLWLRQLEELVSWVSKNGATEISMIAVRSAALLASELLSSPSITKNIGLILWQPVINGKTYINQLYRLRLAAGLGQSRGAARESVASLKEQLDRDKLLEIAGYRIGKELISSIECAELSQHSFVHCSDLRWIELSSREELKLLPVSLKQIELFKERGQRVDSCVIRSDAFWTTQEITTSNELIEATSSWLVSWSEISSDEHPVSNAALPREDQSNTAPDSLPNEELVIGMSFREHEDLEIPFTTQCKQDSLIGVIHQPEGKIPHVGAQPGKVSRGVVIVVGGPQYRVGSHRQFLQLARQLSSQGIYVMRFDYRGMGDSEGDYLGYEFIGDDIKVAIDEFLQRYPHLEEIVLWGLCDGATAAACYATCDSRVTGLVLVNPWVRTTTGQAKAQLKHYYLNRLFQREFWSKVAGGRLNLRKSIASLASSARALMKPTGRALQYADQEPQQTFAGQESYKRRHPGNVVDSIHATDDLVARFATAAEMYRGNTLLILSGNDLTAAEFGDAANTNSRLKKFKSSKNTRVEYLEDADHTFSRRSWKLRVGDITVSWMASL
ncbi:MAG: hydrolase 1, exosortase A system-associated [Cellvibrionaceae bacterium]